MNISRRAVLGAGAAGAAVLSGCASGGTAAASAPGDVGAALNAVLDRSVANSLRRSPERCSSLGLTEERAGYRFIDTKTMLVKVRAGLAYVNENFSEQSDKDYITAVFGDEFRWQMSDDRSVYQLLDVYPSLADGSKKNDFKYLVQLGYHL